VEPRHAAASSRLRLGGFALTVLGAALLGFACTRPWVTVGLEGDEGGVLSQRFPGLDLWQGKVALACAVVLLVGVLLIRSRRSPRSGRTVAVVMIVAGVVAIGVTAFVAVGGPSMLKDEAVDGMVDAAAAAAGISHAAAAAQVDALVDVGVDSSAQTGVFVAIAGAVIATIGAVLGLAWVNDRSRSAEAAQGLPIDGDAPER
jgi:hypothetical protein